MGGESATPLLVFCGKESPKQFLPQLAFLLGVLTCDITTLGREDVLSAKTWVLLGFSHWQAHPCPHDDNVQSLLPVRANGQSIHVRTMITSLDERDVML